MKRLIYSMLIALISIGCEHYIPSGELDSIILKNDLNVSLKILEDNTHKSLITIQNDNSTSENYISINVDKILSVTSNEVYFTTENKYKLSIIMRNLSSDPLITYSFWKNNVTESRYYVLAGEEKQFPTSDTQSIGNEWKIYEELFETKANEKFFKIRIHSNAGIFHIKSIVFEKII